MDSTTRLLPLFPLPIVQFPGAITPLHIFEPRYRKLLKDVLASDKSFGIIFASDESGAGSVPPPPGRIGCAVEVVATEDLPDGRSNILCLGSRRFRALEYVEGEPYLQAEVEFFDDQPEVRDLTREVARAVGLFKRVIAAGRLLKDGGRTGGEIVDLPGDPQSVSCIVSSYLDIDMQEKQELLELVDSGDRLGRVIALLDQLVIDYERRAFIHQLSRNNGHGGPVPDRF
jgi:Lon protease-like protein